MSGKNIVLVGFMGTGKSSVGKALAKKLNKVFVDVDLLIEQKEKKKIQDIFQEKGEAYFRELEKNVIREVSENDNAVITTGGGAVLNVENLDNLKKRGVLVALLASAETIYERVKHSKHRPLLNNSESMLTEIKNLLQVRQPYYQKADFSFDTDGQTPYEVADKVAEKLKNIL